jgi:hypothetical protein
VTLLRRLLPVIVLALALVPAAAQARPAQGWHPPSARDFGATTLALDPAAAQALTGLGVTPSPIDPATATDAGLSFPIVSSLPQILRTGKIRHTGGIALTAGSTRVELTSFTINLDLRPDLTAIVGGQRVSILDLDLSKARPGFSGGRLTLGPVSANLTATAASALDSAFGLAPGTIPAGLKLGDATVAYRLFG